MLGNKAFFPRLPEDEDVGAVLGAFLAQYYLDREIPAELLVSHDLAVVTHLCERLMVMQRGQTVEVLASSDLAAHRVTEPYTLSLMHASSGFQRASGAG